MQVIIDISEHAYNSIVSAGYLSCGFNVIKAVKEGIVLPEEHGDIVDTSKIKSIELEDSLHIIEWHKGSQVDMYIDVDPILPATRKEGRS